MKSPRGRPGGGIRLADGLVPIVAVQRDVNLAAVLRRPAILLLGLLVLQITLGALTVLGNKPFIINSLHVVNGALVLVTSLVLTLRAHRSRFVDAGSPARGSACDDAARTFSPDEDRRATAGEVRDVTKRYGGARA